MIDHSIMRYTAVLSGTEHEAELVPVALRKNGGGESQTYYLLSWATLPVGNNFICFFITRAHAIHGHGFNNYIAWVYVVKLYIVTRAYIVWHLYYIDL